MQAVLKGWSGPEGYAERFYLMEHDAPLILGRIVADDLAARAIVLVPFGQLVEVADRAWEDASHFPVIHRSHTYTRWDDTRGRTTR